ncbi:amidohydrolase family protein [Phenylobacterium montanum]|uniref:Amidohydrolase family protein n=1 Tax=Phenylobacterium montanum TaxID=2823693 RepID=A0A975G479_9CAUL|nr:amidohydrolase family protein [Caulobacter sp. S6]QUD90277.1 amidohydrolase family protein [Caulobacter sp. S6]
MRKTPPRRTLLAFALLTLAPAAAVSAPAGGADLVIEHVTVVPMTDGGAEIRDQTVVIRDGRIAEIGPSTAKRLNAPGRHVDGSHEWLIPGLTDAHAHLENDRILRLVLHAPDLPAGATKDEDVFLPYVANGVTQVVDLSATSETFAQRAAIDNGRVLGPHIVTAAMIDGAAPVWPIGMTRAAADPEAGRRAVRDAAKEGYDLIKVYSRLDLPTFTAIVDEARKQHLPVVGHIPAREQGLTERFFQPGYTVVAHAEEFAQQTAAPDEAAIARYVDMAKRNGTGLIATLTLDERILEEMRDPSSLERRPELAALNPLWRELVLKHNPYVGQSSPAAIARIEKIVAFNRKLVAVFEAAGVPVLAGTDSPVPGVVPGYSLPDELEALTVSGLTPKQALESATRRPNQWLGSAKNRGVVAVGAQADLLLLGADPLADIRNVRRIEAVIVGGGLHSRAELDEKIAALRARHAFAGTNSLPASAPAASTPD